MLKRRASGGERARFLIEESEPRKLSGPTFQLARSSIVTDLEMLPDQEFPQKLWIEKTKLIIFLIPVLKKAL
jgi:hypothetical protein